MELAEAMAADAGERPAILRVDGGMAANDWLCRFLANMIDTPVERPADLETTARGAAFHAGLATGVWSGLDALADLWSREACFEPEMDAAARAPLVAGWKDAVARTLGPAR
jgi:glycerol kinase